MNDDWSLKEYRPGNSPEVWFFRKNLAPRVQVRDPSYPYLAYLTFGYSPRDESGLPSTEDEEALFRIEDEEISILSVDELAVQIGAVTKSGVKDLLFHTHDPEEFQKRASVFRSYTQFKVECEVSKDPSWSQYDDLP